MAAVVWIYLSFLKMKLFVWSNIVRQVSGPLFESSSMAILRAKDLWKSELQIITDRGLFTNRTTLLDHITETCRCGKFLATKVSRKLELTVFSCANSNICSNEFTGKKIMAESRTIFFSRATFASLLKYSYTLKDTIETPMHATLWKTQ